MGYRRAILPRSTYHKLPDDVLLDFSGWIVFVHSEADDDLVMQICAGLDARKGRIWEEPGDLPVERMARGRHTADRAAPSSSQAPSAQSRIHLNGCAPSLLARRFETAQRPQEQATQNHVAGLLERCPLSVISRPPIDSLPDRRRRPRLPRPTGLICGTTK